MLMDYSIWPHVFEMINGELETSNRTENIILKIRLTVEQKRVNKYSNQLHGTSDISAYQIDGFLSVSLRVRMRLMN